MWEYNKGFIIISAVHNGTRNEISTRRTLEAFCLLGPRNCRLYRLLFAPRPRISKNAFLLEAATSIIRCDFCHSPQHLSLAAYAVIARRVCRYFFCRWPTITYADSHSRSLSHTHTFSSSSHSAILHGHSSSNVFFFALIVRIIIYIVRPWLHVISRC